MFRLFIMYAWRVVASLVMLKCRRFIFVGLSVFMGNYHERASTTLYARANKYKPFFVPEIWHNLSKVPTLSYSTPFVVGKAQRL